MIKTNASAYAALLSEAERLLSDFKTVKRTEYRKNYPQLGFDASD